jgi:hypothetical protein
MFGFSSIVTLASATFAIASLDLVNRRSFLVKDGVNYTVFDHAAIITTIVTNSGVCETTPGVNQYSGYISVGPECVVLVLRSPKQPFDRASRHVAEWRPWLQQHDRPLLGEWPMHLQQRLRINSRVGPL